MNIDPESYLLAIETFLKANLNTEIGNLNTEKNDSIVLKTISDEAYFLQTLNDKVANYDPYILIGLDNITATGIGPSTAKNMSFTIVIIIQDSIETSNVGIRLLRYMGVLVNLINRSFNKILPHATFKINNVEAIPVIAVNSNDPYRAIGIQLESALA